MIVDVLMTPQLNVHALIQKDSHDSQVDQHTHHTTQHNTHVRNTPYYFVEEVLQSKLVHCWLTNSHL